METSMKPRSEWPTFVWMVTYTVGYISMQSYLILELIETDKDFNWFSPWFQY